jgi:threonine/homoserine/homoserine lactone efflux protein
MTVPSWVNYLVGVVVLLYGAFRVGYGLKRAPEAQRGRHLFMGVVLLGVAGWLLATTARLVR